MTSFIFILAGMLIIVGSIPRPAEPPELPRPAALEPSPSPTEDPL